MRILYDDNEVRGPYTGPPYHQQNATRQYLRHHENLLYLEFIQKRSDKWDERVQAAKEIKIAQRKMDHWAKHQNFDVDAARRGIEEQKAKWR